MRWYVSLSTKLAFVAKTCYVGMTKWVVIPKWQQHQEIGIFVNENKNEKKVKCFVSTI
ncbi:MAG: hypothetical protein J7L15_01505 [Clostridiales bacterium]|nr:hypothetical protein [Clostridiales bacterium]